ACVVEDDSHVPDAAHAGVEAGRRLSRLETRIAEDALLRLARFPVVEDFLVRAGGDARTPAAAGILIDEHDAVFAALVERTGRTCCDARRIRAVIADAREVHHRHPLDFEQRLPLVFRQRREIRIVLRIERRAAEIVIPVRPALDVDRLSRDLRNGCSGWLDIALWRIEQIAVAIGPWLVIVVEAGLIRVVEELEQSREFSLGTEDGRGRLSYTPAALPPILIFPVARISRARLRLDVVPPHVLGAGPLGPEVLAGEAAGVAADALVEVKHHRHLSAYVELHHCGAPFILRTTTYVSRLMPCGPQ